MKWTFWYNILAYLTGIKEQLGGLIDFITYAFCTFMIMIYLIIIFYYIFPVSILTKKEQSLYIWFILLHLSVSIEKNWPSISGVHLFRRIPENRTPYLGHTWEKYDKLLALCGIIHFSLTVNVWNIVNHWAYKIPFLILFCNMINDIRYC